MSFGDDQKQFDDLMITIGAQRELIQNVVAGGPISPAKQKSALNALDDAIEELRDLMEKTAIPNVEKKRRMAELSSEIRRLKLRLDFESEFGTRMELRRKLDRLQATLGTWESMDVFHFETLLDPNGHDFKTLLDEADKDIQARQNPRRVLTGIEEAFSIAAFGAALAAKLAASSVA